jgi:hypothetical protein
MECNINTNDFIQINTIGMKRKINIIGIRHKKDKRNKIIIDEIIEEIDTNNKNNIIINNMKNEKINYLENNFKIIFERLNNLENKNNILENKNNILENKNNILEYDNTKLNKDVSYLKKINIINKFYKAIKDLHKLDDLENNNLIEKKYKQALKIINNRRLNECHYILDNDKYKFKYYKKKKLLNELKKMPNDIKLDFNILYSCDIIDFLIEYLDNDLKLNQIKTNLSKIDKQKINIWWNN